jgi:hypothetical protein
LQVYLLNVSKVCCKCVHMDITKVDRDDAYVVMAIHVCCKCLF